MLYFYDHSSEITLPSYSLHLPPSSTLKDPVFMLGTLR